jgi:hypothetical protein
VHSTPESILENMRHSPPKDDQWALQRLASFLTKVKIGMVTAGLGNGELKKMGIVRHATLADALQHNLGVYGPRARVLVIKNPDFLILNAR